MDLIKAKIELDRNQEEDKFLDDLSIVIMTIAEDLAVNETLNNRKPYATNTE